MSFQSRTTDDLIRIAAAGGGFVLDAAARPTDDLIRIAAAASNNRAQIVFRGLAARPVEDLIRIGAAGKGAVQFSGDKDPSRD